MQETVAPFFTLFLPLMLMHQFTLRTTQGLIYNLIICVHRRAYIEKFELY